MTRLVPDESDAGRFEFYRMATERFRRAASLGIREIGIGFDLERALCDAGFYEKLWRLLCRFAPDAVTGESPAFRY